MTDDTTLDMTGRPVPHNSRDTSKAAAQKMAKVAATVRERAFKVIHGRKLIGATCENVEDGMRGHSHQSISARLWELAQDNRIFDSIHRRQNRSEAEAIVWVATDVVPAAIVAPYIEYQKAQFALEVLRKTLSNLDRCVSFLEEDGLNHMVALKSLLTELKHQYERIPAPRPLPILEPDPTPAPAPAASKRTPLLHRGENGQLLTPDGKPVLL